MNCPRCNLELIGELEMVPGPTGGCLMVHARCTTAAERLQIEEEAAETVAHIVAAPRPSTGLVASGLRVVCAWCGRVKEEGDPGADVSHGICPACMAAYFPDGEASTDGTERTETVGATGGSPMMVEAAGREPAEREVAK